MANPGFEPGSCGLEVKVHCQQTCCLDAEKKEQRVLILHLDGRASMREEKPHLGAVDGGGQRSSTPRARLDHSDVRDGPTARTRYRTSTYEDGHYGGVDIDVGAGRRG